MRRRLQLGRTAVVILLVALVATASLAALCFSPRAAAAVAVAVAEAGAGSQRAEAAPAAAGTLRAASAAAAAVAPSPPPPPPPAQPPPPLPPPRPDTRPTVLFGLIGRDVAGELPHVLRNIERLASQPVFRSAHVLLVENDSADNTTGVMADWAARAAAASGGRVTGAVHSLPPQHSSKKTLGILAKVRNVYLDEARAGDYRLLIAVDTDMCTPWDVAQQAQVLSNLLPGRGSDWHVASANGVCGWYADDSHIPGGAAPHAAVKAPINSRAPGVRPIYCDLFALHTLTRRPDGWNVLLPPGQCEAVPSRAWQPECSRLAGEAAFQVRAAFGGLTVYDVPFLRGPGAKCAYASNHMGGGCEHTPLNFCLNDAGARLFVVTRLVVNWEGCEGPVLDAVPAGRT